jgi:hypothetical protein
MSDTFVNDLLAKLEKKPKPIAMLESLQVKLIIPQKEKEKILSTTVILKPNPNINRMEVLQRIQEKDIVSTKLPLAPAPISPSKPEIPIVVKKISRKLRLIEDIPQDNKSSETQVIKIRKRRTKKPSEIIKEGPISMLKIGDTSIKDRLPAKEAAVLIKSSSYYMNNREIFINFINSLFQPYKEEMASSEGEISCDTSSENNFSLLTHQKIVRDYLNLYTPYRGLLLYHGLGSGKTCSSIAIAEGMKTKKPIIIMTPASLRMNYIEQLKFCGDDIYKKNQYWEFIKTKDNEKIIKALSFVLSLSPAYIKKKGGAWLVNVKKPTNFDSLTTIQQVSLDEQLYEMIRYKYKFINYNGLRKSHLKDLTKDFTINPFDNVVVIVDEVHNFVSRIVNKLRKPDSLSMKLYEYMMNAKNARFIFLTGTPIINYPNEISILFNILRGKIKTWNFKLSINKKRTVNQETFNKIFEKFNILDFLEYKPSSTTLVITRNPFGFVNINTKTKIYDGVSVGERGEISDDEFIKIITSILAKNDISIIPAATKVETYKALPDSLENFESYFIKSSDNSIKNIDLFKRRILGLTSYFRSAQEKLMPKYDKHTDFKIIKIPMSEFQFNVYEEARVQERKLELQNARKKKKKVGNDDLYADSVSTYRIFSRAFCNFVFPKPQISRPMPHDGETIETALKETADEDLLDAASVETKLNNPDGRFIADEIETLSDIDASDESYDQRIKTALQTLKENSAKYLSPKALTIYSPKFLNILENIQDEDHRGLHLIYSQFRTLEGIGILKIILEANGFAHFKLRKSETRGWIIDISEEDKGKPTFALYTGTETPEEKEITRNIFNSTWKYVPKTISDELMKRSSNNFYGEIIKVLMITSSGAEGINLQNVRYVHITEPYWHPVRVEQVIGRARRICSHNNLPEDLRTIEVFLYLMTFSEKQLSSEESIELRLKDKSKIDNITPVTSDEALYEISSIKEEINKQILTAVKEASIDCAIHAKGDDKEKLQCYTFGSTPPDKFAFKPSISDEESDSIASVNKVKIKWKAVSVVIDGTKYALNRTTNEVFDLESYHSGNPILLGSLSMEGEKYKINWL